MTDKKPETGGLDTDSVEDGVWRYARARRARLVIDSAEYFDLMQQAMLNARQLILLIGWDFDTRIHLNKGRRWWQKAWRRNYPSRLGSFILWLARHEPKLEIRILKWSFGFVKFAGRGSMMLDLLRWWPQRRIDFKFDKVHPPGCCHHQKIVVIDRDFAVCGGIDMTTRRWDTREHLEEDDRRKDPGGKLYGPWHDLTMLMEGEIAGALDDLGRARWMRAGGPELSPPESLEESAWPDGLDAHFENVEIGIARTIAAYDGQPKIAEVEALFLRQIAAAKHFIYIESQYFASRKLGEAIAARLEEDDPPEIAVVHPISADGWIESKAMDPARARLVQTLRELDRQERFHIYVPYTGDTPIYVHAKIMIVDDKILRVGSANFNNRSMALDSECDIFIDCDRPLNAHCTDQIRALRISLLAEHCGASEELMEELLKERGSMAAAIDGASGAQRRCLRRFEPPEPSELEAALAENEILDPEDPEDLLKMSPPGHGLFRPGSLLASAKRRITRKKRPK